MMGEALILGLTLGSGLWLVMSLFLPQQTPTMAQRIAPYLLDVSREARAIHRTLVRDPLVIAGIVLSPGFRTLAHRVDSFLGGKDSQAIVYGRSGRGENYEDYRARRAVYLVTAGIAGALVATMFSAVVGGPLSASGLVGGVATLLIAMAVHDGFLRREAATRSERITEEFPTLLELLGLSLAAGDSLPRALTRVSRRAQGELGREWARVMGEVDAGSMLGPALRDSALRMGTPSVAAFVEHLAQALDRGAPLAEVIDSHGSDAHADYSRSLVDRAGQAEVKMLVPMVLLILPITVIFAVYPGLQALEFGF
jgi:tight adherence protein C